MAWQWKVEIDIESLRRDSEKLGREISSLQDKTGELNLLIESMRDFWEGDAAEAYIEMTHRQYMQALNLLTTLQKLKAAVDTQINELKNVDNFFEKLWYQLFVN